MSCIAFLIGVYDLAVDVISFSMRLVTFNIRVGEALGDSVVLLLISCPIASAASTASAASAASLTPLYVVVKLHPDDSKLRVLVFDDVSECLEDFRKAELKRRCWYAEGEEVARRPSEEGYLYSSPWTAGSICCTYSWFQRQYAAYTSYADHKTHHRFVSCHQD